MFKAKNLTPNQLAFYTALSLALPVSVIVYLIETKWWPALFSFLLLLIGGYLLIKFVLERFIYRKIKLIYKFIYRTKASKREETYFKYILPKKSIDEVAEDVEAWAAANEKEMTLLKANEQFRKEFLQNLSHEFKTPVFAIQSYVETILNSDVDEKVGKRFLEKTYSNAERLTNLLKDLDEISRLETGEQPIVKENFIIQDLIKSTFDSISIKAEKENIKFSIKKGCEAPITVNADKEKIRQVLSNLFENSIKYGKSNGCIKASIYTTDSKRILVEISDDGMGIDEISLPRIFERFYRTSTGRTVDVTGSGLGLAICKHIIEAHGQSIHIRSTENVGTTVGFTLDAK